MKPFSNRPGTGRIQRQIRYAFVAAEPKRELTAQELMQFTHVLQLYQGRTSVRERRIYARALGRTWPGGVLWRLRNDLSMTLANR
jgi:hypothetical protein